MDFYSYYSILENYETESRDICVFDDDDNNNTVKIT